MEWLAEHLHLILAVGLIVFIATQVVFGARRAPTKFDFAALIVLFVCATVEVLRVCSSSSSCFGWITIGFC
jgi:hypothetical protein